MHNQHNITHIHNSYYHSRILLEGCSQKKSVKKIHENFKLKNEITKFEYFQNNKNSFEKEYKELQITLSSFKKSNLNNLTLVEMKKDIQEKINLIEKLNTIYL